MEHLERINKSLNVHALEAPPRVGIERLDVGRLQKEAAAIMSGVVAAVPQYRERLGYGTATEFTGPDAETRVAALKAINNIMLRGGSLRKRLYVLESGHVTPDLLKSIRDDIAFIRREQSSAERQAAEIAVALEVGASEAAPLEWIESQPVTTEPETVVAPLVLTPEQRVAGTETVADHALTAVPVPRGAEIGAWLQAIDAYEQNREGTRFDVDAISEARRSLVTLMTEVERDTDVTPNQRQELNKQFADATYALKRAGIQVPTEPAVVPTSELEWIESQPIVVEPEEAVQQSPDAAEDGSVESAVAAVMADAGAIEGVTEETSMPTVLSGTLERMRETVAAGRLPIEFGALTEQPKQQHALRMFGTVGVLAVVALLAGDRQETVAAVDDDAYVGGTPSDSAAAVESPSPVGDVLVVDGQGFTTAPPEETTVAAPNEPEATSAAVVMSDSDALDQPVAPETAQLLYTFHGQRGVDGEVIDTLSEALFDEWKKQPDLLVRSLTRAEFLSRMYQLIGDLRHDTAALESMVTAMGMPHSNFDEVTRVFEQSVDETAAVDLMPFFAKLNESYL